MKSTFKDVLSSRKWFHEKNHNLCHSSDEMWIVVERCVRILWQRHTKLFQLAMNSSITSKCIKSHHLYTKLLKHLWTGLPLLFINFGKLNISRAKELVVDDEKRKMSGTCPGKKCNFFGGCWDPAIMPKRFQITSNSRQLQRRQLQRWWGEGVLLQNLTGRWRLTFSRHFYDVW